jgi:Nucleotidyl transferase AbiEii toxin, Type IV TA system
MIYKNTVNPELIEVAQKLCAIEELNSFRIVGGTAIALQIGHRYSVDIDFFSNEKVGKRFIVEALKKTFPGTELSVSPYNVKALIQSVRVEIFDEWGEKYRHPPVYEEGLRLAALQDIAALKLTAFTERRQKKDYIDLYFLFKKFGSLNLLEDYKNYNPSLSNKSLLFALDEVRAAEMNKSEMPKMFIPVVWAEIAEEMLRAAKQFEAQINSRKNRN